MLWVLSGILPLWGNTNEYPQYMFLWRNKVNINTFLCKVSVLAPFAYALTHFSVETPKRVIGKQGRPRSDTTECSVQSRSPPFANLFSHFSLGLGGSVRCAFNWWSGGYGFDRHWVRQLSWRLTIKYFLRSFPPSADSKRALSISGGRMGTSTV